MPYFRDQRISSVTIDEAILERLFKVFETTYNAAVAIEPGTPNNPVWYITLTIRADGKGYSSGDYASLLEIFKNAQRVERVIFQIDNTVSLGSNRAAGQFAEVRLDAVDANTCFLSVMAKLKNDGDIIFGAAKDILDSTRNFHRYFRGTPIRILVHLFGIVASFVISVWAGALLGTNLAVENASLFAFLFVFIVISNLWTYIHPTLLQLIDRTFPNVWFKRARDETWTWLRRAFVSAVLIGTATAFGSFVSHYATGALEPLWIK